MKFRHLHPAVLMTLFMFVGMGLLLLADQLSEDRRTRYAEAALDAMLREVAPAAIPPDQSWNGIAYRSPSVQQSFAIEAVYPLAQAGPTAGYVVILTVNGYSGSIRLLAGIDADFTLHKLRVIRHSETPGLGDGIEAGKSDWIHGFDGLAADASDAEKERRPPAAWRLRRHGGEFDNLTGATVTARAILNGVHDALLYLQANPPAPAAAKSDEEQR